MNKEDIIRMAREAGAELAELPRGDAWLFTDDECLERFAKLVRKDYSNTHASLWLDRVHKSVLEEREACAKVAQSYEPCCDICPSGVTNAIRARRQA